MLNSNKFWWSLLLINIGDVILLILGNQRDLTRLSTIWEMSSSVLITNQFVWRHRPQSGRADRPAYSTGVGRQQEQRHLPPERWPAARVRQRRPAHRTRTSTKQFRFNTRKGLKFCLKVCNAYQYEWSERKVFTLLHVFSKPSYNVQNSKVIFFESNRLHCFRETRRKGKKCRILYSVTGQKSRQDIKKILSVQGPGEKPLQFLLADRRKLRHTPKHKTNI